MTLEVVQFRCPTCNQPIGEEEYRHACDTLHKKAHEIYEARLQKLEQKHKQELQEQEEENNRELESRVSRQLKLIEGKILSEQEQKIKNEKAMLTERFEKEIKKKDEEIKTAKLHSARDVDEKIEALRQTVEEQMRKEKEYQLQINRLKRQNRELDNKIQKQQKTLQNFHPEFSGTAGEDLLYYRLQRAFPQDVLTKKTVGVEMPDIVQTIVTDSGERISIPIIWDMKTGENITPNDILKAKRYKEKYNTDYCILVTRKLVAEKDSRNYQTDFIGNRDEIWLVHEQMAVGVAELIRKLVIEKAELIRKNDGKASKQIKLFDYITSSARIRKMQEKIKKKLELDAAQSREEDYMKKIWDIQKKAAQDWFDLDKDDQDMINAITQEDLRTNEQEKHEAQSKRDKEELEQIKGPLTDATR